MGVNNVMVLPLVIDGIATPGGKVVEIALAPVDGGALPEWAPGAHVDIHLPSGLIRQYSLCGEPDEPRYRIAVLRDEAGRGGSVELCDLAAVGANVAVSIPRNHFALKPAASYLFIAGGIGITPLLPMIRAAARAATPWTLVYRGASLDTMCYVPELQGLPHGTLQLLPSDTSARPDLDMLFADLGDAALAYCCGPSAMLDAATKAAAAAGRGGQLIIERFNADGLAIDSAEDQPFEVQLVQSGVVLQVPADRRLGEVLEEAGIPVTFSCEEGYCGTCETRVIAGTPDHRDSVLSEEDREAGLYMMVCCGRSKSSRLVLDL